MKPCEGSVVIAPRLPSKMFNDVIKLIHSLSPFLSVDIGRYHKKLLLRFCRRVNETRRPLLLLLLLPLWGGGGGGAC